MAGLSDYSKSYGQDGSSRSTSAHAPAYAYPDYGEGATAGSSYYGDYPGGPGHYATGTPVHPLSPGAADARRNLNLGGFGAQPGHLSSQDSSPDDPSIRTYADKGAGLISLVADNILSHPFLVLRRQCQVHVQSRRYHLTPFSLIYPVFHICQRQGCGVVWKGLGSSLLVKGMTMAVEDVTSKVTPFPKEITRHSSLKSVCQHILLKSISLALITPFYSASLVETAQSEVASETAGFFDVFREGLWRLLSWPSTGRLVPLHVLVIPTVAHGILSYLIYTGIRSISLATIKRLRESKERKAGALSKDTSVSYYTEMSASLVGHMVADALLFPLETVLHRLHLQGTRTIIDSLDCGVEVTPIITSYAGVVDCIRTTIEEEGFSGLYKGFGALILQYGLQMLLIRTIKIILEKTIFSSSFSESAGDKKTTTGTPNPGTMTQSHSEPGSISTPYEGVVKRPASRQYQTPRENMGSPAQSNVDDLQFEPRYRSRFTNFDS